MASAAQADVSGRARVIDGDTLEVAGTHVRLFGIDALERSQTCDTPHGEWACGAWARDELARLIGERGVRCVGDTRDRYGRLVARCDAGQGDLGAALVEDGAASAYRRYSRAYLGEEARAREAERGMWRRDGDGVLAPDAWRAARRSAQGAGVGADSGRSDRPPMSEAPEGCAIKGNVSANGHIYHLPGQRDYDRTRIDPARGEHWFCSEAEARAAGWRPAGV